MKRTWFIFPAVIAALTLVPLVSRADDDDDDDDEKGEQRGGRSDASARAAPGWAAYQAECGSCHLAYPPRMLPARSWQKLLGGLTDHFGQNAEVDAPARAKLETFLATWAGPPQAQSPLRITELSWWRHEHDEISRAVYARKAIGTAANCAACHVRAEQGDFGEHGVRIPK